ncbi:MAG: leucine-rich repeat domain-containing protein, partial [Oscillospiraceae bacterium]|nr:leucine-rich repeat domain-containing protein [Oscillospiraceae bacterium]
MKNKKHILKRVVACVVVVFVAVTATIMSGVVGLELPKWSEMLVTRASAASEGYYTYSVEDGEATIYRCEDSIRGDVVIPDKLGGYPVTRIGGFAFQYCSGLTSITIPENVTCINGHAFFKCTGLISVTIPDSVISIGDDVFDYCTSLTSVTIGNGVTNIGDFAFRGCTSLISVTIPDGVTNIGDFVFSGCTSLTSMTIPDGVTSIGVAAFSGCTDLTSITIPEGVTSIGSSAFENCTGLTEIQWNAENVSDFASNKNVFACAGTGGRGIDLVFGDNVKHIPDYAFYSADFSEKCKLMYVTFGDCLESIGRSAFYGCVGRISNIPDSVVHVGSNAFAGTKWYEYQADGPVYFGKVFYRYKGAMPQNMNLEVSDGTKSISASAFSECAELQNITIPDSVTEIGSKAFYNCSKITSVKIPA